MGSIRINPEKRYVMFETPNFTSAMETVKAFARMGYDVNIISETYLFSKTYYITIFDERREALEMDNKSQKIERT